MSDLLLNSLEIQRFRAFKHLRIPRFGRVNLIVGKNNAGKTSLLEAIQLYAHRGTPYLIWDLLEKRDEIKRPVRGTVVEQPNYEERLLAFKHLFYGRTDIRKVNDPIKIGQVKNAARNLTISIEWHNNNPDEDRPRQVSFFNDDGDDIIEPVPYLVVEMGKRPKRYYRIDRISSGPVYRSEFLDTEPVFISSSGITTSQIGRLWDRIALTNLEEDVLAALRIIVPDIERLNLISDNEATRLRIPVVKIPSEDGPVPLRSMGGGMTRVLGIALALVNAKDEILLVDEIENGLHYAAQFDLWRLVLRVAKDLNVQVFATTHSWDCIEAFQQATQEDKQEEGMLIRLGHKKQDIVATVYDENELAVVTREQIEVR